MMVGVTVIKFACTQPWRATYAKPKMEAIYGGFEQDFGSVDKMTGGTGGRWSAKESKASLASEEDR